MKGNNTFYLVLANNLFTIPSEFVSLPDVDQCIYLSLLNKHQYEVKSKVSKDVLQSFINHWVKKEVPNINFFNLSEYEQLSQEFDRMKDIIHLFHKHKTNSDEFSSLFTINGNEKKVIKEKKLIFESKIENYQQTIRLLFTNKGIKSHSRFEEVKKDLYDSCLKENLKFVELFGRNEVKHECGLSFVLNEEDKTAAVFRKIDASEEVMIPTKIEFESQEFIVTSIVEKSFINLTNIKSINFERNSELKFIDQSTFSYSSLERIVIPKTVKTIGKFAFSSCKKLKSVQFEEGSELTLIEEHAFSYSSLERIVIPSNVVEIGPSSFYNCHNLKSVDFLNGSKLMTIGDFSFAFSPIERISIPSSVVNIGREWLRGTRKLADVKVTQNEVENVSYFDDSFIVAKSDLNSDFFDVLLFVRRDIEHAVIPSFVRRISPFAFDSCQQLKTLEFHENSELQIIDKFAFSGISIDTISIPASVIRIDESAFSKVMNLKSVTFSSDSKLRTLEKRAFSSPSIESISIPSSIKEIDNDWCDEINNLTNITIFQKEERNISVFDNSFIVGKSDLNQENFDVLLFARRNIEIATIPSFIRIIAPYAFNRCKLLKTATFSENSKLELIEKFAFNNSAIKSILIPSGVTKIGNSAFSYCPNLKKVEFQENSKLKIIDRSAFSYSSIESITIPSNTILIDECAFDYCLLLKNVDFFSNSKLLSIRYSSFAHSSITHITIPPHVTKIDVFAFSGCSKLKTVKCSPDSNLKKICKFAFVSFSIEEISIPSSIEDLDDRCFCRAMNLTKVTVLPCKIKNICIFNNFLLGKSDLKSDNFDVLKFAPKNIVLAKIPPFIKMIGPYSFYYCNRLKAIEFNIDSKLEIIDDSAFSFSSLERIQIPSSVVKISKNAFTCCQKLRFVDFQDMSKLKLIETNAFFNSAIECITILSHVTHIRDHAFFKCFNLQIIEIPDNSELRFIGKNIANESNIQIILFPPDLKRFLRNI